MTVLFDPFQKEVPGTNLFGVHILGPSGPNDLYGYTPRWGPHPSPTQSMRFEDNIVAEDIYTRTKVKGSRKEKKKANKC